MASISKTTSQRRILIPVDESDHSERAFQWYYECFSQKSDFVIIVHASESAQVPSAYTYEAPPVWDSMREKEALRIEELFDKYKNLCLKYELEHETVAVAVNDSLGEAICRAASPTERNADVIIIGSRGLNLLKRAIQGSVSEYLISTFHLPVIVVPPSS